MNFEGDDDWMGYGSFVYEDPLKCPSPDPSLAVPLRDPSPSFMQANSPSRDLGGIPFQDESLSIPMRDLNYDMDQGSTFQTMTTMQSTSYSDLQPMQQETGIPTYEQPTQVINGGYMDNGLQMMGSQQGYYQQQPGPSQVQHSTMHQMLSSNSPSAHNKPITPQQSMSQSSIVQQQIQQQTQQQQAPPPSRSKQRNIQPRQPNGSRKKPNTGQNTVGAVLAKANKLAAASSVDPGQNQNLPPSQGIEMRLSGEDSERVASMSQEIASLQDDQRARGVDHSVKIRDLESRRAGIFFEALAKQHVNVDALSQQPTPPSRSTPAPQRQAQRQQQQVVRISSPQYQPIILQQQPQQYNQPQQVVLQQPIQQIQMQSHQVVQQVQIQQPLQQMSGGGQQQNQLQQHHVQPVQQTTQFYTHMVKVSQSQPVHVPNSPVPQVHLQQASTPHNRRAPPLYKQVQVTYVSQAATPNPSVAIYQTPQTNTSQPQILVQQQPQPNVQFQSSATSQQVAQIQIGQGQYREPSVREVVQVRVGSSQSQGPSHVVVRQSSAPIVPTQTELAQQRQLPQPQVQPPPPVKFTAAQCAKRMEEKKLSRAQRLRDCMSSLASRVEDPQTEVPFSSLSDALQRLLPYAFFHEPDLNVDSLEQADTHIIRSFVNLDERRKQLDRRLRTIFYSQALTGPEDHDRNLLLYLDMEYERRKLEDEKKSTNDETRESFVHNSSLIRELRDAGISDPKGQSRLGQAPPKIGIGVYDYHEFCEAPSSAPRHLPSPSPPPRVYRSPSKSPLKSPVSSVRRLSTSPIKSPPPPLQRPRRTDRATPARRFEISARLENEERLKEVENERESSSDNTIASPHQMKKEVSTPRRSSPIKSPVRSPATRRLPPKLAAKAHDRRARQEEATFSLKSPSIKTPPIQKRSASKRESEPKTTRPTIVPVRAVGPSVPKKENDVNSKTLEVKPSPVPFYRRASLAENNLDEEASSSDSASPEIYPYIPTPSVAVRQISIPTEVKPEVALEKESKAEPGVESKKESVSPLKLSFTRPPPPRQKSGKEGVGKKVDVVTSLLPLEQTSKVSVSDRIPEKKLPLKLRKSRTEPIVKDELENHLPAPVSVPTIQMVSESSPGRKPLKLKISLGPRPPSQMVTTSDNIKGNEAKEKRHKDKKRKKKRKKKHREDENSPEKKPKLEDLEPCSSKSTPRLVLKFSLTKKIEAGRSNLDSGKSEYSFQTASPEPSRPPSSALKVPPLKLSKGTSLSPMVPRIESPVPPLRISRLATPTPGSENISTSSKVPKLRIRLGGMPSPILTTTSLLPKATIDSPHKALGSESPDDALHIQFSPEGGDSDEERNRVATETDEALARCGLALRSNPPGNGTGNGLFGMP